MRAGASGVAVTRLVPVTFWLLFDENARLLVLISWFIYEYVLGKMQFGPKAGALVLNAVHC